MSNIEIIPSRKTMREEMHDRLWSFLNLLSLSIGVSSLDSSEIFLIPVAG